MNFKENPFEYEQATTLALTFVRDVFIEDYTFTRFVQSNRNVFLVGERGSGKSMTFLYNSIAVQSLKAESAREPLDLSYLGIYVPCNTPLTHKREYELIEDKTMAGVISEHFMVLGIAYAIAGGLLSLPNGLRIDDDKLFHEELTYIFGADLPSDRGTLGSLMVYLQRESRRSQLALNALRLDELRQTAFTFSSLVYPLLQSLRRTARLGNTHFLLLLDDAHDLNQYQKSALNSWIAYRDRSVFSFKVAVADLFDYDFRTASGGSILEGHDFLTIDLQKSFQNPASDFGKLAKSVVERRLRTIGVEIPAEEFFPASERFALDLERCRRETEDEARQLYPSDEDAKKRNDHVYKYARVRYFRDRATKANLPPYSGFDTIAHVSTGVIRNLLMPCYWMYDAVYSELQRDDRDKSVTRVPAHVQSQVLRERSQRLWKWIETSLASSIDNCTLEDAKRVYSLFDNLGDLFRRRLLKAKSEPRALAFSVSGMTEEYAHVLLHLFHIARRAQLLYFRSGSSKDDGRRETYYVPNRLLWPIRGLDVVGQHARASLKARDVWAAANGERFPFSEAAEQAEANDQGVLFDAGE